MQPMYSLESGPKIALFYVYSVFFKPKIKVEFIFIVDKTHINIYHTIFSLRLDEFIQRA